MTALHNLHDLFHQELRDIYDAEKQLTKALPRMAKQASNDKLRSALEDHLAETEQQVERLEKIFGMIDEKPRGKKCVGMEGLIKEGSELLKEKADDAVKDAGIIAAAQRVEHYEIAVYGTLASFAQELGLMDAVTLLEETLAEEKDADAILTQCAASINFDAAEPSDVMDME